MGVDLLGTFEQLILYAVMRVGGDAYGVRIRRELADELNKDVSIGAVYTTLSRLEEKGLVKGKSAAGGPERGGRPKRVFRVTGAGRAALADVERATASFREGLAHA